MYDQFKIAKYELMLEAGEQGLYLPPYKGSTLRGGFGNAFRRIACAQRAQECLSCLLKINCPYAYIFETAPPPDADVLRNYAAVSKPFIIEPPLETKTYYAPGEVLYMNLLLFGRAIEYLPYFIVVFRELGEMGIGKGRNPYRLAKVAAVNDLGGERKIIYSGENELVHNVDLTINGLDVLNSSDDLVHDEVTVVFQTMTRLKYNGNFVGQILFHVLIRNLLRRLSSIYYFHHDIKQVGDFQDLIKRAEAVRIVSEDTKWVDWERYSSRQDTRMNLGGLVGKVTYAGDLSEFWPLLILGQWTHVGKAVTFGMGKYEVAGNFVKKSL
ncbi:CRISPR system precrRNA processing endoribonuclease RAMP protein Cas6 [Desulfotruncus alcoholivorax]|uniref:CRISPR system precrRNA processing endoribonuclease RAMP protein Cas6 n=1 Tax=Desulfotruncus alcoholivorax TaxID=265477 RepID=UPI0004011873|nr:CRISPR system precrRNA processing endoribonuclease RAMP protein Cas6 [Desulfotruncus alcoholivorax]